MAREPAAPILDPLRRLVGRSAGSAQSDAQLLENFVARRDEAAFEVLVWRHGAMVLALCKRLLRDAHEAEDAFQATFLVFARKAGSIGRGEVVAAWLYKVAYRIALRLRAASAKRTAAALPATELPAPDAGAGTDWNDLRPVLDDEIARLPEKYRRPFVLCYLEGRTNEEAAEQLGCPKGTVLSRLSRGRERLRERLARRGVALSVTALALALGPDAASAAVPAALVSPTVGAAIPFATGQSAAELTTAGVAALAEGTLKAMALVKLKVAAAVCAVVLAGGIAWGVGADERPAPAPRAPAPRAPDDPKRAAPAPTFALWPGTVSAVAKDGRSFTLRYFHRAFTNRDRSRWVTTDVKLDDRTAVRYDGVGIGGAKLTRGYSAHVELRGTAPVNGADPTEGVAAAVTFTGSEAAARDGNVSGRVADGDALTPDALALDVPSGDYEDVPLVGLSAVYKKRDVPRDRRTVFTFRRVGPGEAKLTAGRRATVWFADDGRTAGRVVVSGNRDEPRRPPDAVGRVTRAADGAVAVEVPAAGGNAAERLAVKLTERTAQLFDDVPLDGTRATPGMGARVWLAAGSKDTAEAVTFVGRVPERWRTVRGTVVALARDGSSVTIEGPATDGRDPKRVEVKLLSVTKVAFFGVGPGEAKLAEGLSAEARLLDGSADTAAQLALSKPGARER